MSTHEIDPEEGCDGCLLFTDGWNICSHPAVDKDVMAQWDKIPRGCPLRAEPLVIQLGRRPR